MISFVKGILAETGVDGIVIETAAGLGYDIAVPGSLLQKLPGIGTEVKIYTHMQVREDGVNLFGFANREDLQMFRMLIGVSGVGPKAAIGILSVIAADDLRFAVLAEDSRAIAKAPGVGTKTARKIILELKDKLNLEEAMEWKMEHQNQAVPMQAGSDHAAQEAVQALTALGYSGSEALRAVNAVEGADKMEVEQILKAALKHISF